MKKKKAKKTKATTGKKREKERQKTKERMMAEPLVVLETPLVDHHLFRLRWCGAKEGSIPVFSSTTHVVAAN